MRLHKAKVIIENRYIHNGSIIAPEAFNCYSETVITILRPR